MGNITLRQLKKNMCKWPIGDPLESGFHFCGSRCKDEHSYCPEHIETAYKKSSGQRRK